VRFCCSKGAARYNRGMIFEIKNLLTPHEVAALREIAGRMNFVDGRATNSGYAQKQNLQADPADASFDQAARIVHEAFNRSRELRAFCLPRRMAPPTLDRYEAGMKYGAHADSAYVQVPGGQIRSDMSSTVFLAEPGSSQGGEFLLHLGDAPIP